MLSVESYLPYTTLLRYFLTLVFTLNFYCWGGTLIRELDMISLREILLLSCPKFLCFALFS